MDRLDAVAGARASAARSKLDVRVTDSAAGFDELGPSWKALHDADPEASVFVSWDWMRPWWNYYGKGQLLRLLAAYKDEQLVGILPLWVQRKTSGALAPRLLRFVGTGGDTAPDYLGPVYDRAHAKEIAARFAEHILTHIAEWDVLLLSDLREDEPLGDALRRACAARGLPTSSQVSAEIAFITLPKTWDDYLAGVSRDRRYTIRNTRRKAEANYGVRFFTETDPQRLDGLFDRLVELHTSRWHARGEAHAFSTPEYVGFHRDAVQSCAQRGWVRFYGLEVSGRPIAMFYCYQFRNRIFYFQAGFDPAFEKMRPGLVLIGHSVEHAIGSGMEVFDFLRGEHEYKNQWGKGLNRTSCVTVYRPTAPAALYRLRTKNIPSAKAWIKRRFPFLAALWRRLGRKHGRQEA